MWATLPRVIVKDHDGWEITMEIGDVDKARDHAPGVISWDGLLLDGWPTVDAIDNKGLHVRPAPPLCPKATAARASPPPARGERESGYRDPTLPLGRAL